MAKRLKPNYSEDEILVLIEYYRELSYNFRHKQFIQVRLMDIERTLRKLPTAERTAVFLLGVMEYSTRVAGMVAGVSKDTMNRRYTKGLLLLSGELNGK